VKVGFYARHEDAAMRFLWFLAAALFLTGCDRQTASTGTSGSERGVLLLRYAEGSESTEQRERGFLETMAKEFPDIKVISQEGYAGATQNTALGKSLELLNKYGPRLEGVFACNESSASGMLVALDQLKLAGKVQFVGFDTSSRMIEALESDRLHGLVLQDPVRMGYLAVKTMVDHLDGKTVETRISTGELVATPENMDDTQVKERLSPKQHSGEDVAPEKPKYRIAVIPKGTAHEFWKSVHAGAANGAAELGVAIDWQGPLFEDRKQEQIAKVQDFVTSKVDGICLAPLDSTALVESVRYAKEQGIPTVIFDSGLADENIIVSYVATDNYNGGRVAARRLGELVKEQRKRGK
jgi:ABC-type sugar transport system substrate-binding protein